MKNTLLLFLSIIYYSITHAQNVGIGTGSPLALLHVDNGDVLFSSKLNVPPNPINPPIQGIGRRMMWYPDRAAFRVGYVESGQWDSDNIGTYSFASGHSTLARGYASTAMGYFSSARGDGATSLGYQTAAPANFSTAMGYNNTAKTVFETVLGTNSTDYIINSDPGNWEPQDRLFTIGNGSDDIKSDAMVILKNGYTGFGTSNPANKFEIVDSSQSTTLTIGNTNGFGAAQVDWLSDYGKPNQWRPGYIQSGDAGGFTGELNLYTNGHGSFFGYAGILGLKIRNGHVGVNTNSTNGSLQFNNDYTNRKIVLYEKANNNDEYNGFGVTDFNALRYQVSNLLYDHIFYAANSAFGSNELMRIKGNGNVGIGILNPRSTLELSRGNAYNDATLLIRGSSVNSQFNYLAEENTFIRGGRSGAKVFIGDNSSAGNILIGGGGGNGRIEISSANTNANIELRQNGNGGTPFIDFSDNSNDDYDMRIIETRKHELTIDGGNLKINGFTKLGDEVSAPSIKMKKLTGTLAIANGLSVDIPHGLDYNKIISVSMLIKTSTGDYVPPSYLLTNFNPLSAGITYSFIIMSHDIHIVNDFNYSSSIILAPVKIYITYEE